MAEVRDMNQNASNPRQGNKKSVNKEHHESVGALQGTRVLVFGQQTRDGDIVARSRAPCASSGPSNGRNRHGKHIWQTLRSRNSANIVQGAEVLSVVADGRHVGEGRRLEHGVVHNAAVRGGIRCWRSDAIGTCAPNLLKLSRRNVGSVIGSNSGPELLATRLVDCAKTVGVDSLGLGDHLGVDSESVVRLRRFPGSHGTGLREQDFVLAAVGRGADGHGPHMGAASIAHRRSMAGGLRVGVVLHGHAVVGLTSGAARSHRRDGRGALAAVAAVRELVEMQAAGQLSLLQVGSNVLVGHLLHTGLE